MSVDDYDHHILQKYRLAAAVAVIKNKPNNLTVENYIEYLRNKITTSEMDINDPDMTICEDDFNFNDDDDYINNDNDRVDNQNNDANLNDSQMNNSGTILKGFDFNEMMRNYMNNDNDGNEKSNSVSDVLNILKGDNVKIVSSQQSYNHSQSTLYESSQSLLPTTNDSVDGNIGVLNLGETQNDNTNNTMNKTVEIKDNSSKVDENKSKSIQPTENTYYDSQKTILYTVPEFTDLTHVSQSQADNIVLPRHLIVTKRPTDNFKTILGDHKGILKDTDYSMNIKEYELSNGNKKDGLHIVNNNRKVNQNLDEAIHFATTTSRKPVKKSSSHTNQSLKEIHQQSDSHLLKASNIICTDNKKHKHNNNDNFDRTDAKRSKVIGNNSKVEYLNEIRSQFSICEKNTPLSHKLSDYSLDFNAKEGNQEKIAENRTKEVSLPDNNVYLEKAGLENTKIYSSKSDNTQNINSQTSVKSNELATEVDNSQFSYFSQDLDNPHDNSDKLLGPENNIEYYDNIDINGANTKEISDTMNHDDIQNADLLEENLFDEITDSQKEVVPFKVLEELNKVKAFLNKRERKVSTDCLSDSGYKSDSQSRSSYKSALQLPNTWLNQSAHCLLSFIRQCTLVVSSADITAEISRVLGQLIDKLHEEEKYPSFLEELLETVESILKQIYEEEITDERLLKKDEDMHRLFLLTKSSHIIKFTIEKIVSILETFHSQLLEEKIIEITNTAETENLAYIFHILETLIKKHIVCKNLLSQSSTQPSQEDEVILKKSSITDIWRKKWNTKKPETDSNVGSQKKCVLVQCGDVLNKIIVQAMDGYSLVSFSALQCFNLLQN